MRQKYRRYDPRLRNMVAESGKTEGFENLDIPKSTLRSWVKNGPIDFITLPELKLSSSDLVSENIRLR